MKNVALLATLALACGTVAQAEPTDQWWSGWGMGIHEYGWSGSDGTSVYITCGSDRELGLNVAIREIDPKPNSEVVFDVDGREFKFRTKDDGDIETFSRLAGNELFFLFDALKKGKRLVLSFDGLSQSLSLKGSARGLGKDLCE
jgi:opacity protein-like surface antigen